VSFYNMLHGVNPFSRVLLALLGKTTDDFGRFRDVRLDRDEAKAPRMWVHTRCGGGNRESYPEVFTEMAAHPLYLFDQDDDFDSTYCDFVFKVPENGLAFAEVLLAETDNTSPAEKWEKMLGALEGGDKDSPLYQRAMEVGKPIAEQIRAAMEKAQSSEG